MSNNPVYDVFVPAASDPIILSANRLHLYNIGAVIECVLTGVLLRFANQALHYGRMDDLSGAASFIAVIGIPAQITSLCL